MDNKGNIELKPCPFCGVEVSIAAGTGRHAGRYAFCHQYGARPNSILGFEGHMTYDKCIIQDGIIFHCLRDAQAWAAAWNRRAAESSPTTTKETP